MKAPLARDALVIILNGDEHPGVIAYGLAAPSAQKKPEFPAGVWPDGVRPNECILRGENWRVHEWDIPISNWSEYAAFEGSIRSTLEALIRGGCRVAWIGAEGVPFCDPPRLFDPECMSGGVLAWMTDDLLFECALDPDRAITPVNDRELMMLRFRARGLADSSNDFSEPRTQPS